MIGSLSHHSKHSKFQLYAANFECGNNKQITPMMTDAVLTFYDFQTHIKDKW